MTSVKSSVWAAGRRLARPLATQTPAHWARSCGSATWIVHRRDSRAVWYSVRFRPSSTAAAGYSAKAKLNDVQQPEQHKKTASANEPRPPPEDPESGRTLAGLPALAVGSAQSVRGDAGEREASQEQFSSEGLVIPKWFVENNIHLCTGSSQTRSPIENQSIDTELSLHIRGLMSLDCRHHIVLYKRAHIALKCTSEGSLFYMDDIVKHHAQISQCDLVQMDGQDLEDIFRDSVHEVDLTSHSPNNATKLSNLHHFLSSNFLRQLPNTEGEEEEIDETEENEEDEGEEIEEDERHLADHRISKSALIHIDMQDPQSHSGTPGAMVEEDPSARVQELIDSVVLAVKHKRSQSFKNTEQSHPIMLLIRDAQFLFESTPVAVMMHGALLKAVHSQRMRGQSLIMICTLCSTKEANISKIEHERYMPFYVIFKKSDIDSGKLVMGSEARLREINLRRISLALQRWLLLSNPKAAESLPRTLTFNIWEKVAIKGLDERILSISEIERFASVCLGFLTSCVTPKSQSGLILSALDIKRSVLLANEVITQADEARMQYLKTGSDGSDVVESSDDKSAGHTQTQLIDKTKCTQHEQRLLAGVVNPDKIQVGFSSVRVPEATIHSLQSLITLPLTQPAAFSYGILSRSYTTGILLFGPPGSGKTLLAKAVAKECGARVLEIKGSEVFDMYVGEGEKNVKAIFSLARKLKPCVVFIDEVDAIFSARQSHHHSPSHREIINQFMVEWDGLTSENTGILIMGATNRPFDIDDAILRRMPRRILVDLPTEEDRLEILKIHLRGENLDPSVSLENIAQLTPFYSGSDLKNLCVLAAINAVNAAISPNQLMSGTTLDLKRRILHQANFEAALKETSPSISEDMSSLQELRKFDQTYGDGNKEQRRHLGFGAYEESTKKQGRIRS